MPGDYPDLFRNELHRQLDALGVRVILGDRLREEPPSEPGEATTFTAALESGERLTADIWFRCYGGPPATDYLGDDLLTARRPDGRLTVTSDLRLPGQPRVFALGDIIATPEAKQASVPPAGRPARPAGKTTWVRRSQPTSGNVRWTRDTT
ncbi:FAD-dependent oxidoreductase [Streptomyces sp. CNQ-509]|uniref:FAD-dependent oxidoreductase n=1 Tax=Streptomyces sp. CNQ-509 TaxID=444103 RepID=UPI0006998F8A|nr:FAD-dependent oxidoreductase [Streptomyces sp. CNQ-509]